MNKHKKGSIFGIIGLVVIFAVVSFLFSQWYPIRYFSNMLNPTLRLKKLNVTLNDAAKKQINNYTSQQVSNKKNDAWRDASATEIKSAMDSGTFIDNEKQNINFRFIKVSRDW